MQVNDAMVGAALEEAAKALDPGAWDSKAPGADDRREDARIMATAAITAYLAQAGKEGWVMVPRDPSPNMRFAGADYLLSQKRFVTASDMWPTWKVMLAAAQNGVG